MNGKMIVGIAAGLVVAGLAGGFAGLTLAERERAVSADAALLTADQALRAGNYDAAIELAFAATDRRPNSYSAYEVVADAYAKGNDLVRARHFYQRALECLDITGGGSRLAGMPVTPEQVEFEKIRIAGKLKAIGGG